MSIKLIGFDIDGTILNSQRIISEITLRAIKKASEMGIHIVPVTGRPLSGIPRQLAALPYIRYLITSNGAVTYDRAEKKILRQKCLTYAQAEEILKVSRPDIFAIRDVIAGGYGHCHPEVYDMMVEISDTEYVTDSKIFVDNVFDYPSQAQTKGEAIENISMIARNAVDCAEILRSVSSVQNVRIVSQGGNGFEVGCLDADKGMALLELGEILGIEQCEIMALGDGGNDFGMLKAAGIGVAMGNAAQSLKEAADFITADCDGDGVAFAIQKYCFENEV